MFHATAELDETSFCNKNILSKVEIYKLTDKIFSRCKKTEPGLYSWIFSKFPEKPARVCLFLSCSHISANELFKTAILLVQGAHRGRKIVFGLTLTFIFPIFEECEKVKLYILNKVDLITFKKIL